MLIPCATTIPNYFNKCKKTLKKKERLRGTGID